MSSLYLLVNLASFIVPFIFSFHPKLRFYKEWAYAWPAIVITAIPFIIWDTWFTRLGVWGFNPSYVTGIGLWGLPLEEVLFFICIPYSCLFTYYCLSKLIEKDLLARYKEGITLALLSLLAVFSIIYFDRQYTLVTFAALALFLLLVKFIMKAAWLSRFYFSYLVLLLPFTIVNGILTGTGIDQPIVWYNNLENVGIRILTIPFEDIFYGMLLILVNVLVFEGLRRGFTVARK